MLTKLMPSHGSKRTDRRCKMLGLPKIEKGAILRYKLRTILLNNNIGETLSPDKLTNLENQIAELFKVKL